MTTAGVGARSFGEEVVSPSGIETENEARSAGKKQRRGR